MMGLYIRPRTDRRSSGVFHIATRYSCSLFSLRLLARHISSAVRTTNYRIQRKVICSNSISLAATLTTDLITFKRNSISEPGWRCPTIGMVQQQRATSRTQ